MIYSSSRSTNSRDCAALSHEPCCEKVQFVLMIFHESVIFLLKIFFQKCIYSIKFLRPLDYNQGSLMQLFKLLCPHKVYWLILFQFFRVLKNIVKFYKEFCVWYYWTNQTQNFTILSLCDQKRELNVIQFSGTRIW